MLLIPRKQAAVSRKKSPALASSLFEDEQVHLALALSVSEDLHQETLRDEASQNISAVALAESTEAERSFSDKSTYSPTPQRPKRVRPLRLPSDPGSPIFRKRKVSTFNFTLILPLILLLFAAAESCS